MLGIDFIECLEIGNIGQKAGRLKNLTHIGSGSSQYSLYVAAALLSLCFNGCSNDPALSRIDGNLTRQVQGIPGCDGLAVWAYGGRSVIG